MSLARATRSELTKASTTKMWWLLLILSAAIIAVLTSIVSFFAGINADTVSDADLKIDMGIIGLIAGFVYILPLLLGMLIVTSEFRHATLTPTFLATPRRGTVLWAKLISTTLLGLILAVATVIAGVLPTAGFLAGFGVPLTLGETDTLTLIGRTILALTLWAMIGVGVGAFIRNQVAAIVIVLGFVFVLAPLLSLGGLLLQSRTGSTVLSDVVRFFPGAATDALVDAPFGLVSAGPVVSDPLTWWVAGIVLAGYAVVLMLLSYLFTWRRDVK